MQISSLIDIIDGKLLNTPSISFIYSFKTKARKVKESDLFLARNKDDIEIAIKNGAYSIIIDYDYPILDNEIAWIKVDSIDETIIKLTRYYLSNYRLQAFYCTDATYDLISLYNSSETNIVLVPRNVDKLIKILNNMEDDTIFISPDKMLLEKIYPKNTIFPRNEYPIKNLIEHSLFESTFSNENMFYSRIKIPSLYINEFLNVNEFFKYNLDYTKLRSFMNFKPLFLDKNFNIIDYGKSDKFIITQYNINLVQKELSYINSNYSYGKLVIIKKSDIKISYENELIIEDLTSLKDLLSKKDFNALYIIGFTFEEVEKALIKKEDDNLLF